MPDSMPTDDGLYRKSSFSGGGDCVAVLVTQDEVRVRNSRLADQGALVFTHREWAAFVAGVKAEEFEVPHP